MSRFINPDRRALDVLRAVQGLPTVVVFRTLAGVDLPAQTVRIAYAGASAIESAAGEGALRRLEVFAVRDHPTLPDTDIAPGYRFNYGDKQYRILDPILPTAGGEVQAQASAV